MGVILDLLSHSTMADNISVADWRLILRFLSNDFKTLGRLMRVSRRLNVIVRDCDEVWVALCSHLHNYFNRYTPIAEHHYPLPVEAPPEPVSSPKRPSIVGQSTEDKVSQLSAYLGNRRVIEILKPRQWREHSDGGIVDFGEWYHVAKSRVQRLFGLLEFQSVPAKQGGRDSYCGQFVF